jgi:hypothetical protein
MTKKVWQAIPRYAPGIPRRVGMECPGAYLSRYAIASGIVRLTPQASLVRFQLGSLSFYFLRQDVNIGLSEYFQMQKTVNLSKCQIKPPYGGVFLVI